jgi:hypothetical protein
VLSSTKHAGLSEYWPRRQNSKNNLLNLSHTCKSLWNMNLSSVARCGVPFVLQCQKQN